MVSMVEYLNEGRIWNSLKSSFANLFGGPAKVKKADPTSSEKIEDSSSTFKRLTPKALASTRNKLGYKPKKTTV